MKQVDSFLELGHIKRPILTTIVLNPYLLSSWADGWHWFEVIWLFSSLNSIQLIPEVGPYICWELSEHFKRISNGHQVFVVSMTLYQH